MSGRFQNIESIDGGFVAYDAAEEDEADTMNADTFGEDAVEEFKGSSGFFDIPSQEPVVGKSIPLDLLFARKSQFLEGPPPGLEPPPPPGPPMARPPPGNHFEKLMAPPPPQGNHFEKLMGLSMTLPPPPPPPPAPMRPPSPMAGLMPHPPMGGSMPHPPPPLPPLPSIHVVPVRVFPTPFTARQRAQALTGQLDVHKWGRQEEFIREHSLMTAKDKEFVTKIQLNQMVALSASSSQNYRGQFTFGRSSSGIAAPQLNSEESSSLGKRLYASVHHPRKLVTVEPPMVSSKTSARAVAEECMDLLLEVCDVDEYIATLHPLAEDKINGAIIERTELIEKITNLLLSVPGQAFENSKLGTARKRTIDLIVQLVQPPATVTSDAQARRSLIFRRVPESVQGFYIDLLEKIVEQ